MNTYKKILEFLNKPDERYVITLKSHDAVQSVPSTKDSSKQETDSSEHNERVPTKVQWEVISDELKQGIWRSILTIMNETRSNYHIEAKLETELVIKTLQNILIETFDKKCE